MTKTSEDGINALLAKELAADGITVKAVAPGPIAGAMSGRLP